MICVHLATRFLPLGNDLGGFVKGFRALEVTVVLEFESSPTVHSDLYDNGGSLVDVERQHKQQTVGVGA
ncbi:hypothetical protein U1Q18_011623 [Sarracenia purpurea var. burkii]